MREHLSGIYEYDFDFHSYIEKQLRMIDDLDERKYAKRLLLEGMEKMIRCMDERYEQLEQRIYHEIEISDNHYEVAMTVIKRQDYDPTNPTLFPVVEEDIDGSVPEMLEQDTPAFVLQEPTDIGRRWSNCINYFRTMRCRGKP